MAVIVWISWGCAPAPAPEAPERPLVSEGGRLLDAQGRQVLLRGVNARVEGLFDVTFDDGRVPLEEIPPFSGEDCRFLAESLGLDLLRLPVNWSGIEPEPDQWDDAYLQRIVDLVTDCHAVGVWTLVDLHQDAYGKDIGEDGAPLWAIHPPPETLLEGPLTAEGLAARRLSPQVLAAFDSLYANASMPSGEGVRDAYVDMAARLATALVSVPGVAGIELHNEPVSLGDQAALDAFHEAVAAGVREVDPDVLLAFEPDAIRNLTDVAPAGRPFGFDGAIYAPHVYTDVFETGWASEDVDAVHASVALAAEEAVFHDAHLLVGEFGHDPSTERGRLFVQTCLDAFDRHGASWAVWLYEEHSQGAWGLWDEGDEPHTRGALREPIADLLARPYPAAVAGHLDELGWDEATDTLTVRFSAPVDAAHVIAVPSRRYPDGVSAWCGADPAPVEPDGPGRVTVTCADGEMVVRPASRR